MTDDSLLEYDEFELDMLYDIMLRIKTLNNIERSPRDNADWMDIAIYVMDELKQLIQDKPGLLTNGDDFNNIHKLITSVNDTSRPNISDWL